MWPNSQETVDLVTFTGEFLNGKPIFFCSVINLLSIHLFIYLSIFASKYLVFHKILFWWIFYKWKPEQMYQFRNSNVSFWCSKFTRKQLYLHKFTNFSDKAVKHLTEKLILSRSNLHKNTLHNIYKTNFY